MRSLAASTPPALMAGDAPARRQPPKICKLLWAAAVRARNRCVLFATSFAGLVVLVTGHPWVALALAASGAATYGVLVIRDLFDPKLIRHVHGLRELTPQLPASTDATLGQPLSFDVAMDVLEPEDHRKLFREIVVAHEAVRALVVSASPTLRAIVLDMYLRSTEMARLAEPLALRGQELSRYLSRYQLATLDAEASALAELAEESSDSQANAAFLTAANAKQNHLTAYREVQDLRGRIKAQLTAIKTSMQSVEARLVKLAACDADVELNASTTLDELSDSLCLEIDSLEAGVF